MQDGECWGATISDFLTEENEYGFWLTTLARSDFMRANLDWPMWHKKSRQKHSIGSVSEHLARMGLKGFIKIDFHEWLMGWPTDWTDLKPLETDRLAEWQQQHGGF
jgi:hypothetical protein